MPKRALDVPAGEAGAPPDRVQRKTERSHEENQERAYIAASRRADRSIEARVQSARMASEIHKKRTGKGFKISEEIVMKEEMYEEEEDELPRHYRALAAHLQTNSSVMNERVTAYLSSSIAMASMARQAEVNRLFAEQFPNASNVSQQLSRSAYFQPLQAKQQNPSSPQQSSFSPGPPAFLHFRSQPLSQPSTVSSPAPSRHASYDTQISTPPQVSDHPGYPHELNTAAFTPRFSFAPSMSGVPVDPHLGSMNAHAPPISSPSPFAPESCFPTESPFTSELPLEAKMLACFDTNDPMYPVFMGGGELMGSDIFYDMMNHGSARTDGTTASPFPHKDFVAPPPAEQQEYFHPRLQSNVRLADPVYQGSRIGTPGGGNGDSWDDWVNADAWTHTESADPR